MRLERPAPHLLITTEWPVFIGVIGFIFIGAGIFLFWQEGSGLWSYAMLLAGVLALLFFRWTKVTFDKNRQRIVVISRSMVRRSVKEIPFSDVRHVLICMRIGNRSENYALSLETKKDSVYVCSESAGSADPVPLVAEAKLISNFIGVPLELPKTMSLRDVMQHARRK